MMNATKKTRIVVADDHALFCEALRRLLESEPDFDVVATCGDGEEAVRRVLELAPDVLLLDVSMPHMGGLDALEHLSGRGLATRTLMLTADIDSDEVLLAIQLGARGVVMKDSPPHVLFKCVRMVMAGDYCLGRQQFAGVAQRIHDLAKQGEPAPASRLSARELEIIAAVVEGAGNKDIAQRFSISMQTVKNHLSHIFDKLGVSSRLELALYAAHHHLLDKPSKLLKRPR